MGPSLQPIPGEHLGGWRNMTDTGCPYVHEIGAPCYCEEFLVVAAAIDWFRGGVSIPSRAFILNHVVADYLREPCSCGDVCELDGDLTGTILEPDHV